MPRLKLVPAAPAAVLLVALSAAAASAETAFPVTLANTKYASLSRADCLLEPQETSNFAVNWSHANDPTGQTEKVYLSRSSSCSDSTTGTEPDALILRSDAERTTSSGRFPAEGSSELLTARKLFDFIAGDCGGDAGIDTTVYLCVTIDVPQSGLVAAQTLRGSVAVKLDSVPPPSPTEVSVEALDGGATVNWTMPADLSGTSRFFVHVVDPEGKDKGSGIAGSSARSASIDGLQNGVEYTVTVTSLDAAGTARERNNESKASDAIVVKPQAVQDFYGRYRAAGGTETGGCATSGVPLAALALLPLLILRRRRAALAAAGLVLTGASSARAEDDDEQGWQRSPRHFAASLRAGAYDPQVDSEPGLNGATPFADIFGRKSPKLWRFQLDLDLFQFLGRFSAGVDTGYWQVLGSGRSLVDDAKTKDTVTFTIVPMTPTLTYRADFLWDRWQIPVVPFGKAGYGLARWDSGKAGSTSKVGDDSAAGWAKGLEWGAGLQIVLDAVEPDQAASLDQDFGINSTRLFVEYDEMRWRGKNGLRLDGTSWTGGLLLAF